MTTTSSYSAPQNAAGALGCMNTDLDYLTAADLHSLGTLGGAGYPMVGGAVLARRRSSQRRAQVSAKRRPSAIVVSGQFAANRPLAST